ncbi:MAG: hypothetical protein HFJ52_01360 [Clostridia bacterium]|nr:hypothetical protein [Clostridia bacterium]
MERKLKIILCTLVIVLITLIAFVGVYVKDVVIFKSKLPEYSLAPEFGEKRITSLKISEEENEIIYDKDGKIVDAIPEGANEEDYEKKKEKVNKEDAYKAENYKIVKKVIEGRLENQGVEDYKVRVDENTGKATIELPDDLKTDTLIQYMLLKGDFSIKDSKTGDILMDKTQVESAKAVYTNSQNGGVVVILNIRFNKEGKVKLAEISKEYLKTEDTNKTEENETENEESSDEDVKKVTVAIQGQDVITTQFEEEMTEGELPITFGTATDAETLTAYLDQARFYAMLIDNQDMPLIYEVENSISMQGKLEDNATKIVMAVVFISLVIICLYLIFKYKVNGIIAILSFIAWVSLLLIIVRYTATELSLNSIVAITVLMILDVFLVVKMLSNIEKEPSYENVAKTTLQVYVKNVEVIIAVLIAAVVFTFMQKAVAFSFGMTLFYGIISIAIANLVFLRTMLLAKYSDK